MEFKETKLPYGFKGTIICKDMPYLANLLRCVILGELKNQAFDISEAILDSDDKSIMNMDLHKIKFIKIIDKIDENAKIYINYKSEKKTGYDIITSDHIQSNVKLNIAKNVSILELKAGSKIFIKNIKLHEGTGNDHASFKYTFMPIKYVDTDYCYIYRLNEKGYIDQSKVKVKSKDIKQFIPFKETLVLLSNKEYEKLMNEETKHIFKQYEIIYDINTYDILTTISKDFIIEFYSLLEAKKVFEMALKHINDTIDKINYEIININEIKKIIIFNITNSWLNPIKYHCLAIDKNLFISANDEFFKENKYKSILIKNVNAEKIFLNSLKDIKSKLSHY